MTVKVPARIDYSNTAGNVPGAMENGEIAINQADGRLFYRNAVGAVTALATGAGGGEPGPQGPQGIQGIPGATGPAGPAGSVGNITTDVVSEGANNKYFTDARAKAALTTELAAKASTTDLALKADATAVANKANINTTNTFTAAQTLSYVYPGITLSYPSVMTGSIALNASGNLEWAGSDGTKYFYVTSGGRLWCKEWGFVHDRIEERAAAYAAARQAQLSASPIKGGRWMYSGDYSANQMAANYPGGGEPFAGAFMSGFAASGGYMTVGRFRYLQLLTDAGNYITIGYGN